MSNATTRPWASGPGEILRHGLKLLGEDSDTNRRFAMIAIDNAVELTIKTYLGLPKRVTGLHIPRKEYQEISESFPALSTPWSSMRTRSSRASTLVRLSGITAFATSSITKAMALRSNG